MILFYFITLSAFEVARRTSLKQQDHMRNQHLHACFKNLDISGFVLAPILNRNWV